MEKPTTENNKPNDEKGSGKRYNEGKLRYDLAPGFAQQEYVRVLTEGAKKYGARNWQNGMPWTTVIQSLKRHIQAFENGEDFDPETGCYHLGHAMCNVGFLLEYYKIYPQGDDRPHTYLYQPKIGLDLDDVCAKFVEGWSNFHSVPLPTCWNFDRNLLDKFDEMRTEGVLNEFYLNLEPKEDPRLIPFEPAAYVTARPIPSEVSEKWLDNHCFPAAPVITVGPENSKVEAIKALKLDYFVDDNYRNFVELNKAGICTFLYTTEHNKRYDVGHKRIDCLDDLKMYL